jgi:hypothetical protein
MWLLAAPGFALLAFMGHYFAEHARYVFNLAVPVTLGP